MLKKSNKKNNREKCFRFSVFFSSFFSFKKKKNPIIYALIIIQNFHNWNVLVNLLYKSFCNIIFFKSLFSVRLWLMFDINCRISDVVMLSFFYDFRNSSFSRFKSLNLIKLHNQLYVDMNWFLFTFSWKTFYRWLFYVALFKIFVFTEFKLHEFSFNFRFDYYLTWNDVFYILV